MPSSHAITYRIKLCCKRYFVKVGLRILVTLYMFKAHHTADDTRGILDGGHAVCIVWVLALGDQVVNGYSKIALVLSINALKRHISISWKGLVRHSRDIQRIEQSLHYEVSSDTYATHPLVQS